MKAVEVPQLLTPRIDRQNALKELQSDDNARIVEVLLAIALYEEDAAWAVEVCAQHAASPDDTIRGIAMVCFGHIARRTGAMDRSQALPLVRTALNDPSPFVRGHADAALTAMLDSARDR